MRQHTHTLVCTAVSLPLSRVEAQSPYSWGCLALREQMTLMLVLASRENDRSNYRNGTNSATSSTPTFIPHLCSWFRQNFGDDEARKKHDFFGCIERWNVLTIEVDRKMMCMKFTVPSWGDPACCSKASLRLNITCILVHRGTQLTDSEIIVVKWHSGSCCCLTTKRGTQRILWENLPNTPA